MKKFGFTLAEVLITLGIVGVVSALTIPTFTTQMQMSKVGPRLAKSISVFEQASKATLDDAGSDRLMDAFLRSGHNDFDLTTFWDRMTDHIKGNKSPDFQTWGWFYTKDGSAYDAFYKDCRPEATMRPAHLRRVCSEFMIDIDGREAGPNSDGRDRFYFQLMDDGSLRPWGGSWDTDANRWQTRCPKNVRPVGVNAKYCAGHVMENGLKAEYK